MKECHDCGVKEGELHLEGCDMEHCSKCGKQTLMYGNCKDAKSEPFFYEDDLRCARCGKFPRDYPTMVSNKEWKFICGVTYRRDCILCKKCMEFIKEMRERCENGSK